MILHSCEVVPTAGDVATWPDKWWHIFGGLHSVFGYRTIMYIDDGATTTFGKHMAFGYAMASAWLNDVVASSLYTASAGAVMHGVWKRYGRPSVITVCGHVGDNVYNTAALPAATCLNYYSY